MNASITGTHFRATAVAGIALMLSCASEVFAAAGDTIGSRATINYIYKAIPFVQESSPTGNSIVGAGNGADTAFTEDRSINFVVQETDNTATGTNSSVAQVVTTFTVANLGNGPQDFLLAAFNNTAHSLGATAEVDNIDTLLPIRTFVEDGTTAGYQPGEDTEEFIDELVADPTGLSPATVYVVADMPVSAPGDLAAVTLVAQVAAGGAAGLGAFINADDNGNISPAGSYGTVSVVNVPAGTPDATTDVLGEDIVFNEFAGANPEDFDSTTTATDVARNGQHSATDAYLIEPARVVINKSVTVQDTLGGIDPHAGATLVYQLDVIVSGVVNNLVVTDSIPANTTYTSGSVRLDGASQTDAADGSDFTNVAAGVITVDLGEGGTNTITPPASFTITFEVTID